MNESSILIVSPLRNEAQHIERMARSLAQQTVVPHTWLAFDDGSTDETWSILQALRPEISFLTPRRATAGGRALESDRDRLAAAAAPRAFNAALDGFDPAAFSFIAKIDGDVELPPDYFEHLLERFDRDPRLGIASGDMIEEYPDGWRRIAIPAHHVPGAVKLYTRACFEAIGGIANTLGWDTIDEVTARALGFRTRSYRDIQVKHNRHWGSADGTLRGRARHGRAAWILGYPLGWAGLRSAKLATVRPLGVSGLAFLYGYLDAATRRPPRTDPEFRRLMRAELRGRARRRLRGLITTPAIPSGSPSHS